MRHFGLKVVLGSYVVSKAQVEFLKDQQVSAEQHSGHAHVAHGLTDERHSRAAAIQPRQVDPGVQTCMEALVSRTPPPEAAAHASTTNTRCDGSVCSTL